MMPKFFIWLLDIYHSTRYYLISSDFSWQRGSLVPSIPLPVVTESEDPQAVLLDKLPELFVAIRVSTSDPVCLSLRPVDRHKHASITSVCMESWRGNHSEAGNGCTLSKDQPGVWAGVSTAVRCSPPSVFHDEHHGATNANLILKTHSKRSLTPRDGIGEDAADRRRELAIKVLKINHAKCPTAIKGLFESRGQENIYQQLENKKDLGNSLCIRFSPGLALTPVHGRTAGIFLCRSCSPHE
ncbi:hypothetical protein BJ166DRAFT_91364 [Pestalotiopsis sp. NC0098]|nr:hypothetical protein BJ166DRAFT_91364 [Pestalotiopsis sp. NC0098]